MRAAAKIAEQLMRSSNGSVPELCLDVSQCAIATLLIRRGPVSIVDAFLRGIPAVDVRRLLGLEYNSSGLNSLAWNARETLLCAAVTREDCTVN